MFLFSLIVQNSLSSEQMLRRGDAVHHSSAWEVPPSLPHRDHHAYRAVLSEAYPVRVSGMIARWRFLGEYAAGADVHPELERVPRHQALLPPGEPQYACAMLYLLC